MENLIKCNLDDIPERVAYDAHRGTSWSPDERAAMERREYVKYMEDVAAEFAQWATPENEAALRADLETFRAGFVSRKLALLAARSRIVSVMIAGPSGWKPADVRRNERANASADKRTREFLDYVNKALPKLREQYDPRRRALIAAHAPIRSDEGDAIERLQAKIAAAEELQAKMKAVNAIMRRKDEPTAKVAAIVELGFTQAEARKRFAGDYLGRVGFAPFELTNNNANIRRMKERVAALEAEQARREVLPAEYELGGATVIENADIDRLQIVFPGKPDVETRTRLKARGFHWSPREGAWQRLLNNSARNAAREVLNAYKQPTP